MASVASISDSPARLMLATTYEGDSPALLERIAPLVDVIEISPDTIGTVNGGSQRIRPEVVDEYQSVARDIQFIAHGVGLSIGSYDRWNEEYFRLLDELFERLPLKWHSEHLACTTVNGESLGTMLAMPRTEEALDLVSERVVKIERRYGVPFLLEHVIRLLPEPDAEMSDAAFLNALTARTGCGLILDAYNLECDRHNYGFCVPAFFEELNFEPVRELHVAGGVQHKGFQLDIHSRQASETTLAIAREIILRSPNLSVVTYEFLKEAIPGLGHDTICSELGRIRKVIQNEQSDGATAWAAGVAKTEACLRT